MQQPFVPLSRNSFQILPYTNRGFEYLKSYLSEFWCSNTSEVVKGIYATQCAYTTQFFVEISCPGRVSPGKLTASRGSSSGFQIGVINM